MVAMSGPGNLLPEQVWDTAAIPERDLYPGRPTGSAMPLAWAHAELIKLATHGKRGRPVEQLPAVTAHLAANPAAAAWHWRVDLPFASVPAGKDVVIDHPTPFTLGIGDRVLTGAPIGAGRHGVTLTAAELPTSFELRTSENASAVLGREEVGDSSGRSGGP
jgi:glucoamylase